MKTLKVNSFKDKYKMLNNNLDVSSEKTSDLIGPSSSEISEESVLVVESLLYQARASGERLLELNSFRRLGSSVSDVGVLSKM